MGFWSILIPEASTNLATNPSLETNSTNWAADGTGTLARSDDYARFGVYSAKIVGAAAGTAFTGGRYTHSALTGVYSVSFWVYPGANTSIWIQIVDNATNLVSAAYTLTANTWQRLTFANLTFAGGGAALVKFWSPDTTARTYYVDGLQIEAGDHCTTYIDGDQAGGKWAGTAHGSTSSRSAQERSGGREYNFDSYSSYVVQIGGAGMPPIDNFLSSPALLAGATYQGQKVRERLLTLTIHAKGTSRANLHLIRQQLIDAFKPDATSGSRACVLRYNVGTTTATQPGTKIVQFNCRYDDGLEFTKLSGFSEPKIPLRLLAEDPFVYEDAQETAKPSFSQSVANANAVLARIDGQWQALSSGMAHASAPAVNRLAVAPDGTLYAAGLFSTAGGVAASDIAKWDGAAWSALSSGCNGTLYALATTPSGALYVGGTVTTAGGVAVNLIAKWDGSVFTALGTGLSGGSVPVCTAIAIGPDGSLYATGTFTTAGGVAVSNIAKWDGTNWTAMGTGLNNAGNSILVDPDGNVYVGGIFTSAGGVTGVNGIAKWDGSAWSALSSGVSGGSAGVYALAMRADGGLYLGGSFTTAGGVAASNIALWNGTGYSALGSGVDAAVETLQVDADGTLYVAGFFTSAGGLSIADHVTTWNGSVWRALDVDLPGTPYVYALALSRGDVYLGFDTTGTATAAGVTTVTNNGKASAYPVIRVYAAGTLQRIENWSDGKVLYFNLALQTGEVVTLDLRPGKRKITSNWRGNLFPKLQDGSRWGGWRLLPGANKMIIYISGSDGNTAVRMSWDRVDWSVDQVGNL